MAAQDKPHVSLCVAGNVDSGKSTSVGRMIYDFGGIPEREMEKLRKEAEAEGKGSFAFAY